MTLPCPCCRAQNAAGPACRRCKADLSLLFAVEEQRDAAHVDARRHAAIGEYSAALAALDRADGLHRGADVAKLRAAVHLLNRDFAAALASYTLAREPADRPPGQP